MRDSYGKKHWDINAEYSKKGIFIINLYDEDSIY